MINKIKIPVAIQITIDDLGWHDGRDYTNIGKASRSGIPRDHVLSDYQFMNELGRALNRVLHINYRPYFDMAPPRAFLAVFI